MSYHHCWFGPLRPLAAGWVAALALLAVLAGCSSGSIQTTATGGAGGRVGDVVLRDAQIIFTGPIAGDTVYQPGDNAALQLTIVNEGDQADRLIRVSSPISRSVTVTGDTRIPGHQTLTAGYPASPTSAEAVRIVLTGLRNPVSAGFSYPVVFAFQQAGELRLELPVENPTRLRLPAPRSPS